MNRGNRRQVAVERDEVWLVVQIIAVALAEAAEVSLQQPMLQSGFGRTRIIQMSQAVLGYACIGGVPRALGLPTPHALPGSDRVAQPCGRVQVDNVARA